MYNAAALKTAFSGTVGFFQPFDPEYQNLPADLLQSDSGRYVQMIHPLCSIENLHSCAPEFDKFNYQYHNSATAYSIGAVVEHNGKQWIAVAASTNVEPGSDLAKWGEYNGLSTWLKAIEESAILELFKDFVQLRKLDAANRSLIDSLMLFDGIGSYADKVINRSRFVGFQITPSKQQGLQPIIDKIGLQADKAITVPFYLFHSSRATAIKTFNVTVNTASSFNWQTVTDAVLSLSDAYSSEGSFFLGYYQDDLATGTAQAMRREYHFVNGPCIGCNEWNTASFNKWSKQVKIAPFYIESSNHGIADADAPDFSKVVYDHSNNFGINIALTVSCDLTAFFSQQKHLFSDALAMKIALKLLNQIAYTTRMNVIPDKTKALAMADLSLKDEDSFISQYQKEIKALQVDFQGLNSACMPCASKAGITYGAV